MKKFLNISIILLALLFALSPVIITWYDYRTGQQLLSALYEYEPTKIVEMDERLKKLVTADVYNKYSLGSDQRQLRVYLKLMGVPASPEILSARKGRIVYSLRTNQIDSDRVFQLEYKIRGTKVSEINESEMFFLPPSGREFFE